MTLTTLKQGMTPSSLLLQGILLFLTPSLTMAEAGHKAYTIRIFPEAGHGLTCVGSPTEFVPGYFDTINTWLDEHLRPR